MNRRTPPQAVEVERAVLGAMLQDPRALAAGIGALDATVFYEPRHERIFEAFEQLFAEGAPADHMSVSDRLERSGHIGHVRGSYLLELTADLASTANVEYHAAILREKATLRRVISVAMDLASSAYDPAADALDVVDALQAKALEIALAATTTAGGDAHVRHAAAEALARTEDWRRGKATDFASSGIYSLDARNGGLPIGEVTHVASFSGMGKTALLCHMFGAIALGEIKRARRLGTDPRPALIFTAEMSREQLVHRLASQATQLDLRDLRSGRATAEQYDRYDRALGHIAQLPLYLDEEPAPTFAHVNARVEQVRQASPGGELAGVGLDYDEKVSVEGKSIRSEELRVSAIAQGIKVSAKRHRCAYLSLGQYSRPRDPHASMPTDEWLRYSGKKQHEAAQIIHWAWPAYWVSKGVEPDKVKGYDPSRPDRGYLIVTKARFGPLGKVELDFKPKTVSFRDPQEPGQRYTAAELARRPQAGRDAARPTGAQERAQDVDDLADAGVTPPNHEPPF